MKFRHLLGYLAAALIAAAPMTIAAYADEIYDWSSTAANNNSAPPAGFPENMNYSEVNDAARELMAVVKRQIEATDGTNTTSGTEPAYTLTSGQSLGAAAGHVHVWTAHATSTGSVTLNVDAAGAKNVVDAFGTQLGSGAIVSGGVYMSVEEASTHQVIGTFSAPPVGGPASSTDNAVARFNGTAGQVIQNSGIVVDDSNNVSGMGTLSSGAITSSGSLTGTTVELGGVTDTTIARASAGNATIEGNALYRAGGTDVAIADGGTGQSTAASAFDALKQAATESATGVVELATTAEAETGADTTRAVTAAGVLASINANSTGVTLLTSGTVSSAATLDVVLTSYTSYKTLLLVLSSFVPSTDDTVLWLRFSTNGGSSYDTTGYRYAKLGYESFGSSKNAASTSDSKIILAGDTTAADNVSNVTAEGGADMVIRLFGLTNTARYTRAVFDGAMTSSFGSLTFETGSGQRDTAQDTDAIRVMYSSGNIASGSYALYGFP